MIIIINTPRINTIPYQSYASVCLCCVEYLPHVISRWRDIGQKVFFPRAFMAFSERTPSTLVWKCFWKKLPGVTWLVITVVLCAYILIYIRHYFVFSVLSCTIPASAICSNGVSTFERAFFLNCSTALFCTSHYKRKQKWMSHQPNRKTLKPHVCVLCSVVSVRWLTTLFSIFSLDEFKKKTEI